MKSIKLRGMSSDYDNMSFLNNDLPQTNTVSNLPSYITNSQIILDQSQHDTNATEAIQNHKFYQSQVKSPSSIKEKTTVGKLALDKLSTNSNPKIQIHKISNILRRRQSFNSRNNQSQIGPSTDISMSDRQLIQDASFLQSSRLNKSEIGYNKYQHSNSSKLKNGSTIIVQSDISPIKSVNGQEYLLPEIGLSKYRDLHMVSTVEQLNPFKFTKNSEKMLVERERQRETDRLMIIKKRLLQNDSRNSVLFNQDNFSDINQLNDISMISLGNSNRKQPPQSIRQKSTEYLGYMENKKDRSGIIRFINEISASRNYSKLRSISELRGTRKIKLDFGDKPAPIKKVNIMEETDGYERLKEEELKKQREKQMNEIVLKNIKLKYSPLKLIEEKPQELSLTQNFDSQTAYSHYQPRKKSILDDPTRYLNLSTIEKEQKSVRNYIDTSRKLLFTKIQINDKESELQNIKEALIQDQEKLMDAQKSLKDDTEKFKNYQDEVDKQFEKVQYQLKDSIDERKILDEEIERYQNMLQEVDCEIRATENEMSPWRKQKKFIFQLAEDFIYSKQRNLEEYKKKRNIQIQKEKEEESFTGSIFLTQKNQLTLLKSKYDNEKSDKNLHNQQDEELQEGFESYTQEQESEDKYDNNFNLPFEKRKINEFMDELEESNLFLMRLVEEEDIILQNYEKSHRNVYKKLELQIEQTKESIQNKEKQIQDKLLKVQENEKIQKSYKQDKISQFFGIMDTPKFSKMISILRDMHFRLHVQTQNINSQEYKHQQEQTNNLKSQLLLKQVEDRLMHLSEAFDYVHSKTQQSSAFQRKFNEKLRLVDIEKRHKKQEGIKEREKQERQDRYEKNMERMKRSEKIKLNKDVKNQKLRSRKPRIVKFIKKIEPSQEELDYQKYVENLQN
eukprot:403338337